MHPTPQPATLGFSPSSFSHSPLGFNPLPESFPIAMARMNLSGAPRSLCQPHSFVGMGRPALLGKVPLVLKYC